MDYYALSLERHEKSRGKIKIESKVPLDTKDDLSIAYTPGVAEPCRKINTNPEEAYKYTSKGNLVAVITDGSAVLGLGNIGALAGMPVMEGKAILFKKFADVDAFPICLNTQDTEEIIKTIQHIAPTFGGINLEDIAAPRCFEIEKRLIESLDIPIFHDDQHGTAIVVLAGLINALKLTKRTFKNTKFLINGCGAAGTAIAKLLIAYGVNPSNLILLDSKGTIHIKRNDLNPYKQALAKITNQSCKEGGLSTAINGVDVFIGVSKAGLLTQEMVRSMAKDPIVMAMANPEPEIMPADALAAGAAIVATGRSDFSNQINNVLAFPGIFRGVLDTKIKIIGDEIKILAAETLANIVKNPTNTKIIPDPFHKGVADKISQSIIRWAQNNKT